MIVGTLGSIGDAILLNVELRVLGKGLRTVGTRQRWSEKHTLDLVSLCRDEEVGDIAHASDVEICNGEHVEDDGSVMPDGVFFAGVFWSSGGTSVKTASITTPDATVRLVALIAD